MPPRGAKKGSAKKAVPPKPTKVEALPEPEEVPLEAPSDKASVDTSPSEKVAVEEAFSAAGVAEEAVPEVEEVEEEASGEVDAMDDAEEVLEDEDNGGDEMEEEEGNLEDGNLSEMKEKSEECKVENVENPQTEDGAHDREEEESDSEEHDENEKDPSSFMPTCSEGSSKLKEVEIFVGGLNKNATEDDLIKIFSVYGEVQAARIAKTPSSNKSRGFAFIQYATIEQAKKALAELKDGVEVLGKHVIVSASTAKDTLYLGNICKTWTSDQVRETLQNIGLEPNMEILLPDDTASEGHNKGFAFLEFSSYSAAMAAFQLLKSSDACFGVDKRAKVAFARSTSQHNEEVSSQVKTVYVEGFSPSWDEEKIKNIAKEYGEVESVEVVRRGGRSKMKEFGFIAFMSRESALACIEGINNTQVGEEECKLTASLAKSERKRRVVKQSGVDDSNGAETTDKIDQSKKDGSTNSNVRNFKKPNQNAKNTQAKKQLKSGNKNVPEHFGGKKRKGKMPDAGFRDSLPKRQRWDRDFGNEYQRNSRYASAAMEPHAGMLPAGRHGGNLAARHGHHQQPDVFHVPVGGPYSYSGYGHYPRHEGPYPYGGGVQYPPRNYY